MSYQLVRSTFFAITGLALVGCAVETSPPASHYNSESLDATESDISTHSFAYVTLRKDHRKCAAPLCGGFWVKDVNKNQPERYVSDLDFKPSGLESELIDIVREAPAEELIVFGKLGPMEKTFRTRTLLVYEAYRGMPGVTPLDGDLFFKAEQRNPPIQCFAAPCPNQIAYRLNTNFAYAFDDYQVELASRLHVDQTWLSDRVRNHGALVAALFVQGEKYPAGYAYLLDASQVFLNVTAMTGPCPVFKLAACEEGAEWTYTRDENLCLIPDSCVANDNCPSLVPPRCEDGYSVAAWPTATTSCIRFACDPTFVPPT